MLQSLALARGVLIVSALLQVFHDSRSTRSPCPRSSIVGRQVELDNNQMMEIMRLKGVPYVPDYMAPSEEQAKRQFPNMIKLTEAYKEVHLDYHHFVPDKDNELTMKRLLHDLEHLHNQKLQHLHPRTNTDSLLVQKLDNLTSALLRLNFTISSKLLTKLLPGDSAQLLLGRRKRQTNADGSVTETQYCKERGTLTPDGSYLRMCSTCSATTTLPTDHFPRVINEVVCSNQDRGCLTINGVDHGRCTQKVFHLNMLRKKNDSCETVSLLGDASLSDQWEIYTQPIRVSCECEIDKLSMFAGYIPANTSSP
ncbi:uncharacterized protein LOC135467710 isoform X2 [Liolophura sinensis]